MSEVEQNVIIRYNSIGYFNSKSTLDRINNNSSNVDKNV